MENSGGKGLLFVAIVIAGAGVGYFVGNSGTAKLESQVTALRGQIEEERSQAEATISEEKKAAEAAVAEAKQAGDDAAAAAKK
ncbi:MAG: hypothetical protein AAGI06_19745, partial [Pseudomonadota bacterium]